MKPPSKVLVVDDDDDVRQVLRIILQEDFEVFDTDNGFDAVSIAAEQRPRFIVLDYMMPRRDGEVTAREVRATDPDAVIVCFSAVINKKPAWADAFIGKHAVGKLPDLLRDLAAAV